MKKHLKYIIFTGIFILITIFINTKSINSTLPPENAFFLHEEIILKTDNIEFNLEQTQPLNEGSVVYNIYNENDKQIGIASFTETDKRRLINFNLIDTTNSKLSISEPIKKEQWSDLISLICMLYGGFSDDSNVYDKFIKDIKSDKYITDDGNTVWDKKIDGKYIFIRLNENKDINTIIISNKFSHKEVLRIFK